jgi:hypothetical protein
VRQEYTQFWDRRHHAAEVESRESDLAVKPYAYERGGAERGRQVAASQGAGWLSPDPWRDPQQESRPTGRPTKASRPVGPTSQSPGRSSGRTPCQGPPYGHPRGLTHAVGVETTLPPGCAGACPWAGQPRHADPARSKGAGTHSTQHRHMPARTAHKTQNTRCISHNFSGGPCLR